MLKVDEGLELWGGVECTVNRVGDTFIDQIVATGHDRRPEDLDAIHALGVRCVRYPVLWERTAPNGLATADFTFADERLSRLRALGTRVVVGLVHHGSGPRGTDLLDDGFAPGLAAFATEVARRYPSVSDYTPINEPLTTARFSALYGHWYPHARNDRAFVCALWNEIRATVAAMRAIRTVNPRARLVQTEDMGRVFSTPKLAYQARFENARRWLSLDLLCGKVDRAHALRRYIANHGVPERELDALVDEPCPPALVGMNYYVTSDRFLDDHLALYPPSCHGGNGRDVYADVEAVRVAGLGIVGHRALLEEAHARFGLPVALTEVHLGCSEEEQVRWFRDAWQGALEARATGVDVRAVTAWSLFGAYDWDSLVTRARGSYEPGVFDVRDGSPRPTALARVVAAYGRRSARAIDGDGWWSSPGRVLYSPPALSA